MTGFRSMTGTLVAVQAKKIDAAANQCLCILGC